MDEVREMPDYKELYLTMVRASEKAIRILIEAQQACEEQVMDDDETPTLYVLPKTDADGSRER